MEDDRKKGVFRLFFGGAVETRATERMLREARERMLAGARVAYCESDVDPLNRPPGLESFIRLEECEPHTMVQRHIQVFLIFDAARFYAAAGMEGIRRITEQGVDVFGTLYLTQLDGAQNRIAELWTLRGGVPAPDELFDEADEVSFIEYTPRFGDSRSELARLNALRDLAMRRMEARQELRNQQEVGRSAFEHVLVCVSSSPSNPRVLRTAARLARAIGARLTALYVDTQASLSRGARKRLQSNLDYARHIGAAVVTVYGANIAMQVTEYARIARVTKIVVGRPNRGRTREGLPAGLTQYAPNIETYLIPEENAAPGFFAELSSLRRFRIQLKDIFFAVGVLLACTLVGMVLAELRLSMMSITAVYTVGVIALAWRFAHPVLSVVWVIPTLVCLFTLFDFPAGNVPGTHSDKIAIAVLLLVSATLTGYVTMRAGRAWEASAKNAYNTGILLSAGQALYGAEDMEQIAYAAMRSIQSLLSCPVLFGYADLNGGFTYRSMDEYGKAIDEKKLGFNELGAAQYAFENNVPAGAGTDNFRYAVGRYVPSGGHGGVNAVLGMFTRQEISRADAALLDSLNQQISFAVEKYQTDRQREQATMHAENEMLRANLLRAISHDLRTPLTGILGSAGLLMGNLDEETRMELVQDISQDAKWLVNLVENVLSVTRIEDGRLHISLTPQIVDDIVDEAIAHGEDRKGMPIIRDLTDEILLIRADPQLLIQVLVNLIANSYSHGGSGVQVILRTRREGKDAIIEVEDNGVGIPDDAKGRIFELFYTTDGGADDRHKGLGLGLALCRSILREHGGTIAVRDAVPHGAVFVIRLPAIDVTGQEVAV